MAFGDKVGGSIRIGKGGSNLAFHSSHIIYVLPEGTAAGNQFLAEYEEAQELWERVSHLIIGIYETYKYFGLIPVLYVAIASGNFLNLPPQYTVSE